MGNAENALVAEAQRLMDRQAQTIDSIRERGGRLLAVSTLLAGLFAVATKSVDGWQAGTKAAAIILAALVVVLVLLLELPRTFRIGQEVDVATHDLQWETGVYDADNTTLALAAGLADSYTFNERPLRRLRILYMVGIGLVAAQLVMWALTAIPTTTEIASPSSAVGAAEAAEAASSDLQSLGTLDVLARRLAEFH
jgi:hypothetical protein